MAFLTGWERFILVALLCAPPLSVAHAQPVSEYAVKAAYLYNFAKFVDWPPGTFTGPKDPIQYCLLGDNPFGQDLEDTLSRKTLDERPLRLKTISSTKQADGCHVLFISGSEQKRMRSILSDCRERGILTVGESEGFTGEGGIVRFFLADGKIRLEFNTKAAEEAKLRISAKLLSLGISLKEKVR